MPKVELTTADVDVLRDGAMHLRKHGEHVMARRLEALADYASTVIRQASRVEAPLPGPRPRDFGQVYDQGEVTPSETP